MNYFFIDSMTKLVFR